MIIKGLQKFTTIDYQRKLACTIFLPGCNFRCGYCYNRGLVFGDEGVNYSEEEILDFLKKRKNNLEGVCVCGGEPTLSLDKKFLKKIKDLGYLVKLDTNGSKPLVLQELRKEKLVDYVAMDVKGPTYLYPKIVGREFIDERDDVGKGIGVVSGFPDYEFRTTIVPVYENEKPRWINPEEIRDTAELIYDYTGIKEHKFFLQKFISRNKGEIMDERFSKENLPNEMWETPREHMEKCLIEAKKYLPNCEIR
jgi:pyruvate formate lyase activating enzyme